MREAKLESARRGQEGVKRRKIEGLEEEEEALTRVGGKFKAI